MATGVSKKVRFGNERKNDGVMGTTCMKMSVGVLASALSIACSIFTGIGNCGHLIISVCGWILGLITY